MDLTRREMTTGGLSLGLGGGARAEPAPTIDDASQLNPTRVYAKAEISQARGLGIDALRVRLAAAQSSGRSLIVAGARHSMGGQSIPRGGDALTLSRSSLQIDRIAKTYRVSAGATWGEVISKLAPVGLSPAVTQANNDFAVGGAISVNAHGWATPLGSISSTIRWLRVMLANGSVVECSPTLEPELFSLVIGGYGLFGVILEAELDAVDDGWLAPMRAVMPAALFGARFSETCRQPGVRMAFGRLSMAAGSRFLTEALLTAYHPTTRVSGSLAVTPSSEFNEGVTQAMFRGQAGSEVGKRLRWVAETRMLPLYDGPHGRNQLMNTSVSTLGKPPKGQTDILHEYFLPPARLEAFLAACRRLIPASQVELLNITLRYLSPDRVTALAYAPTERVAAVMFFNQTMDGEGERRMRGLTTRLIDAALANGGSFYLPYRLHASHDQLTAAYPRLDAVLAAKRRLDPNGVFRSLMWDKYFA